MPRTTSHHDDDQLELFPYEGTREIRDVRSLTRVGIEQAATDLIALLNEATAEPPLRTLPITIFDIAKYRLNISEENIPPALVENFAETVRQIQDERYRLKTWVEEKSQFKYRLVLVNDKGETALQSRRPAVGFDLRKSDAGITDDAKQMKMSLAKLIAITGRRPDLIEREPMAVPVLQRLSEVLVPTPDQIEPRQLEGEPV